MTTQNHATTDTAMPVLEPGSDDLLRALAAHPFMADLDAVHLERLGSLLGMVQVDAGIYVFRHGQPADTLYLVTEGTVALEIAGASHEPLVLETLHGGDALGWSWLYPPHTWHLDARVVTPMTAITLDAPGLRRYFADDPVLAAVMAWRIGEVLVDRLQHARAQLASVQLP